MDVSQKLPVAVINQEIVRRNLVKGSLYAPAIPPAQSITLMNYRTYTGMPVEAA